MGKGLTGSALLLLGQKFAHEPIFITSVGQEPPDDQRDLFRRQLFLRDHERIRFTFERHEHGRVHPVWSERRSGISIHCQGWLCNARTRGGKENVRNLERPRTEDPCPFILRHVWCCHAFFVGVFRRRTVRSPARLDDGVGALNLVLSRLEVLFGRGRVKVVLSSSTSFVRFV